MNADLQTGALRRTAIAAGVCFLITHVTSVAAPFLYAPALNNAGYIAGPGPDAPVLVAAFLEVILAMAIVGTSVALFPAVRRQNMGVALGYVGLRTLEACIIVAGVLPMLALVALRQQAAGGADAGALTTMGNGLVAFHNATFVMGPGLVCGVNTVCMAYLMYKTQLVPRFIPLLGLVGGPLVFAYNTAVLFGLCDRITSLAGLLVIPIFAWEVSLALWMIFKGFRPAAVARQRQEADVREALSVS